MSTTAPGLPEGRYGGGGRFGGDDRRADRRLRVAAVVCGVLFLGLIAWLGASYLLRETKLHGEVPTFRVVSGTAVTAHLSVRKQSGVSGVCTLRSESPDHTVVGQLDVAVPAAGSTFDKDVTIRTTAPGTTAELLGCVAHG
ncbi:DUF4307 domain-containing protein [Peterkaempfera griseoplana]|uniref:DUF4307 domain-containing protein n=1 Tax=Peterkaempfera griseoplana TaxID=66896 RepID=UPI0006E40BBB|nr:DUF4307 domain-containing protein [Peterkaempfera griseoplana]